VPAGPLKSGDIPIQAHNAKAGDVAVNAKGGAAESLIGTVGRVTVSIPANGPGEVLLPVRGGTEAFAAWSDEPIARHSRVVVVDALSARSVLVTPTPI
jgi:membrane-bound ClpP family serine protease